LRVWSTGELRPTPKVQKTRAPNRVNEGIRGGGASPALGAAEERLGTNTAARPHAHALCLEAHRAAFLGKGTGGKKGIGRRGRGGKTFRIISAYREARKLLPDVLGGRAKDGERRTSGAGVL